MSLNSDQIAFWAMIVAAISAIVSIVSVVITAWLSSKANELANRALQIDHGTAEVELQRLIAEAKREMFDLLLAKIQRGNGDSANLDSKETQKENQKENPQKSSILDIDTVAQNFVLESLLNAYEVACMKYIDNKIDQDRFKKTYQVEIRRLFEDETTKDRAAGPQSKYWAIKKVHDEWENPERAKG